MKTPRAIGLAIALMAALTAALMVPAAAMAKDAPPAVSPQARKAGMEKAPAIVQAAGLPCQVSDARLMGEDKKAKKAYFEVACAAGTMGYVIEVPAEGTPNSFSCIEANTSPEPGKPAAAPCLLPGNANPAAVLQPILKTAGVDCAPSAARGIGQTKTSTYLEVACQRGFGYIVVASSPFDGSKPVQAQNCLMYDDSQSNIKCTLEDAATRLQVIDNYAAAANNGCAVKERRFVGMSRDNSSFYEASCQDGKGYIYKVAASGSLTETYECAKATQILGGCTLTDARQAQTEQAALYTKLAKDGGRNCDVDHYALFPTKPGEEVAELVCKDGSGAILMSKGATTQAMDCGHSLVAGYKCSLGTDSGYTFLTADLKKYKPDTTCVVSDTRVIGKTDKGTIYVEVACSDKLKGYVIEFQTAPKVTAVDVVNCSLAGNCKLPGNT